MAADIEVRPMRHADLDVVHEIANAAFRLLVERNSGRKVEGALFADAMGAYRLRLDPEGCHVAVGAGEVVGANFSVLRGTLGWFGPLAVRPDAQGQGIGQLLVSACLESAERRGATLMGLETLANSPQHIHLYQKLGFRPSWTGVAYRGPVGNLEMPPGVEVDADSPDLDYLYPGFDAGKDAAATRSSAVGITLRKGTGFAVCHFVGTLWPEDSVAYLPLIVAPDRGTFDVLLAAIEATSREHGKSALITQVPGSAWATQEALIERGYRPGGAALRMKRGDRADYDGGTAYYCDDWH